MAAPLITAITTVPNRENATNQASFSNDVDTFFSEVDGFQTQANTQAQYLDGVAAQVDASKAAAAASAIESAGYASTALDARDAAISSAVYKGTWEGKTSAGVIGESYSYKGSYIYRLNVNLANISTSEPSPTNTNWQLINVVPFEAPCKPTLDLDFANQDFTIYDKQGGFVKRPLADIVSQGRATAGTSTDAIGGVTEFAAGENRFTFDGETGEALGYLSEESRTNLLTYSEFPNGLSDAPSRSGLVTLSSMDLGNGDVNALAFGHDGSATSLAAKTNYPAVSGTIYTLSVFVEMEDGGSPSFGSSLNSSNLNDFTVLIANRQGNPLTYSVEKFKGSIYRVTNTIAALDTSSAFGVYKQATNSPRTFKVTGYQLEVSSFPTSYIRTLNAPVTRAADAMTRTLGQEWNPNEGTFVVEANIGGGREPMLINLFSSAIGRIYISRSSGVSTLTTNYKLVVRVGGVSNILTTSIPAESRVFALSVRDNSITLLTDTNYVFTQNLPTGLRDVMTLCIGTYDSAAFEANGTIKRLKYYPRAFDPLTLQRLSRIQ